MANVNGPWAVDLHRDGPGNINGKSAGERGVPLAAAVSFRLCFKSPTTYVNCQNPDNMGTPFPNEESQDGLGEAIDWRYCAAPRTDKHPKVTGRCSERVSPVICDADNLR